MVDSFPPGTHFDESALCTWPSSRHLTLFPRAGSTWLNFSRSDDDRKSRQPGVFASLGTPMHRDLLFSHMRHKADRLEFRQ